MNSRNLSGRNMAPGTRRTLWKVVGALGAVAALLVTVVVVAALLTNDAPDAEAEAEGLDAVAAVTDGEGESWYRESDAEVRLDYEVETGLTVGTMCHGAQRDVLDVMEHLQGAELEEHWEQLRVVGRVVETDDFGDEQSMVLHDVTYDRSTVESVSVDDAREDRIWTHAEESQIHHECDA